MKSQTVETHWVRQVLRAVGLRPQGGSGGHEVWVDGRGRKVRPMLRKHSVSLNGLYRTGATLEGLGVVDRRRFMALVRGIEPLPERERPAPPSLPAPPPEPAPEREEAVMPQLIAKGPDGDVRVTVDPDTLERSEKAKLSWRFATNVATPQAYWSRRDPDRPKDLVFDHVYLGQFAVQKYTQRVERINTKLLDWRRRNLRVVPARIGKNRPTRAQRIAAEAPVAVPVQRATQNSVHVGFLVTPETRVVYVAELQIGETTKRVGEFQTAQSALEALQSRLKAEEKSRE